MTKRVVTKAFYQIITGVALSFIYMQFRPYESYTLAWPFAFLAAWFLLWGWIAYLRYDRLSVFNVSDRYKKQIEAEDKTSVALPGFLRHINTPIRYAAADPEVTPADKLKIRMGSNFICSIVFILLTVLF